MTRFARRPFWAKQWLRSALMRTHSAASEMVSLSFDDGPHSEHTPGVLDRLATHGITATFFLVGERIPPAQVLVDRMTAAGHRLGNHTYSHRRLAWSDNSRSLQEVAKCQAMIPAAKEFRPPFGRLTPGLWRAARRHGLRCVHWSLDSGDWQCETNADAKRCAAEILELVRPGDLLLLHDSHQWIGPILDQLLPELERRDLLAPEDTS